MNQDHIDLALSVAEFLRKYAFVNKAAFWTLAKYLLPIAVLSYVLYANWDQGLGDVSQCHVIERQPFRVG